MNERLSLVMRVRGFLKSNPPFIYYLPNLPYIKLLEELSGTSQFKSFIDYLDKYALWLHCLEIDFRFV